MGYGVSVVGEHQFEGLLTYLHLPIAIGGALTLLPFLYIVAASWLPSVAAAAKDGSERFQLRQIKYGGLGFFLAFALTGGFAGYQQFIAGAL